MYKKNNKLQQQQHRQQQQRHHNDAAADANDIALQVQPKYHKQRQQQLLQSYKHCKRRRKSLIMQYNLPTALTATATATCSTMTTTLPSQSKKCCWWWSHSDSGRQLKAARLLNKFLVVATMFLITLTCTMTTTTICQPIEAAAATSPTSMSGIQIPPLTALLKAAAATQQNNNPSAGQMLSSAMPATESLSSSLKPATSTSSTQYLQQQQLHQQQQQQRQQQQQQLFALLKLNGLQQTSTQETKNFYASPSSFSTSSLRTKNLKEQQQQRFKQQHRLQHHRQHFSNNDNYDDDDDNDNDNDPDHDDSDNLSFPILRNAILETSGFVADDGQQYEKAEKALATAGSNGGASGLQSPALAVNNNLNCPKECKCLNDYFDCGKKHLDRVPILPSYVQIM